MSLTRRDALASGAAALALAPGLSPGLARASTQAPAIPTMRAAATRYLESLSPDQRQAVQSPLGDRRFAAWTYMTGSRPPAGLALERLEPAQKEAARALLATGLSAEGLIKADNVMLTQDILRDEWNKGAPDRSSERFAASIFGTPSATDPWAWRWEGHHLTLTFTLIGDTVVSWTPNSFSAEPNTVPSGPHRGLVVLSDEERLGRALFADLSGRAARRARLADRSPGNIAARAGTEGIFAGDNDGLALADMAAGQREVALRLIDVYFIDWLPAPLAEVQRARLGDLEAARFGWAGDLDRGSVYYRLTGETFSAEFATLRNQPEHHHTSVQDPERTLGRHVL